jgi:hypothetical protein
MREQTMNRFRSVPNKALVLLTVSSVLFLLAWSDVALAQSTNWKQKYDSIHEMYYVRGQQEEAIQALEDEIESAGNTYSDDILKRILAMMKEYFAVSKDAARFENLVYAMLEPERLDRIVDSFKGSSLYDTAKKAKAKWLRPASAAVSLTSEELDVGESTTYRIAATNQKKQRLSNPDITVTVVPPDYARIEGETLVALKPGEAKIMVADADGNPLAERVLKIRDTLAVTVNPDYKELKSGESETFTVQSNKPLSKFDFKLVLEPKGLVKGNELPSAPEDVSKRIVVTAKEPGTAFLKVTDANGAGLAQATIYIPPKAPSMLYPLIGSGVTVGLAVYAFIARSQSNDKFDEHELCVADLPPGGDPAECNALYQDYDDLLGRSNMFWVFTGVAAAGTGYLWYKYFTDKKEYDEKLKEGTRPVSLYLGPSEGRIVYTYRF